MNSYLYHHGILGQKWGVRRFQNKDGSYTSAGKKRYSSGFDAKKYKEERKKYLITEENKNKLGASLRARNDAWIIKRDLRRVDRAANRQDKIELKMKESKVAGNAAKSAKLAEKWMNEQRKINVVDIVFKNFDYVSDKAYNRDLFVGGTTSLFGLPGAIIGSLAYDALDKAITGENMYTISAKYDVEAREQAAKDYEEKFKNK